MAMTLEDRALKQFDQLVQSEQLSWDDSPIRNFIAGEFRCQFKVAHSLNKKPYNLHLTPASKGFVDEDPNFELEPPGPRHRLILNKYSAFRPQFVLPTRIYESQAELLNVHDFEAVSGALTALGNKYMAIYNCGKDAGASVGHKHLQILPKPSHLEAFPFVNQHTDASEAYSAAYLPCQHAIISIAEDASAQHMSKQYVLLLDKLKLKSGMAHNMILTQHMLMVVPRSRAWIGSISANAASMVGLMLCWSEEQYQDWIQYGPFKALEHFGFAWQDVIQA